MRILILTCVLFITASCQENKEAPHPIIGSWTAIERETIKYDNVFKQVISTNKVTPSNGLKSSVSFYSITKSDKGDFEMVEDSLIFSSGWPDRKFQINGQVLVLKHTLNDNEDVESRVTETYIKD